MLIILVLGIVSFVSVGLLWIISSLIHRPIFAIDNANSGQQEKKDRHAEEDAAVTVATWTILHPPS